MFECVSSLLKTDPESEVRQAAAMFITLLLQGLGSDSFKVGEGSNFCPRVEVVAVGILYMYKALRIRFSK